MVNEEGQLYTIEGFTAAAIMLITAYFVFGAATVFVPGDAHISDMQLEQMGSDALMMMDTPVNRTEADWDSERSVLERCVQGNTPDLFKSSFTGYLRDVTGATRYIDDIHYNATVYYRDEDAATNDIKNYHFSNSTRGELICRESAVSVTRWIYCDYCDGKPAGLPVYVDSREQEVLMEVMLWRD
ncbi:MAG: hypothetical protein U9N40_01045 [Euryarchaeota archaeon]|nr:hypothetical protein [Euryarchaeota archaeon]